MTWDALVSMFGLPEVAEGGDEAHEVCSHRGYHPERGHVEDVGGQFVWKTDIPAFELDDMKEKE